MDEYRSYSKQLLQSIGRSCILYVIDSRRIDTKEKVMKFRTIAKIMQEQFGWNPPLHGEE
jgi:hypothetical protein